MKPIEFPEANNTLQKPAGWTDEDCGPLPVFSDGKQSVSLCVLLIRSLPGW
ncbi:hypothetical protein LCGC14_2492850 [marine sediment metagenome]|uniref:Uncharacterized protein n=1 Tax=marine sediment metagenome TaxID=412755 RepID=A0A0F9BS84_9ZZZZ